MADFRRISEEIVSMEHLDQIFQECQVSARSSALTPIISQYVRKFGLNWVIPDNGTNFNVVIARGFLLATGLVDSAELIMIQKAAMSFEQFVRRLT